MKKTGITIAFTLLIIIGLNAQINKVKTKLSPRINLGSTNLNIETIKNHISTGKYCYEINTSTTAIIPPNSRQKLKAIDAHFSTTKNVKVERNYLRINGALLRSDKEFKRVYGNYYEILIHPDGSNKRLINKNQIMITWKTPEKGLKTFSLRNVSIQYKPYGVLIIGDYEIDGIVFGVNIGLIPTTCLI